MATIDYTQAVKYDVERALLNSRRTVITARLIHELNCDQTYAHAISKLQAEMRDVAVLVRRLSVRLEPKR
jgi:hypothetical protein